MRFGRHMGWRTHKFALDIPRPSADGPAGLCLLHWPLELQRFSHGNVQVTLFSVHGFKKKVVQYSLKLHFLYVEEVIMSKCRYHLVKLPPALTSMIHTLFIEVFFLSSFLSSPRSKKKKKKREAPTAL